MLKDEPFGWGSREAIARPRFNSTVRLGPSSSTAPTSEPASKQSTIPGTSGPQLSSVAPTAKALGVGVELRPVAGALGFTLVLATVPSWRQKTSKRLAATANAAAPTASVRERGRQRVDRA